MPGTPGATAATGTATGASGAAGAVTGSGAAGGAVTGAVTVEVAAALATLGGGVRAAKTTNPCLGAFSDFCSFSLGDFLLVTDIDQVRQVYLEEGFHIFFVVLPFLKDEVSLLVWPMEKNANRVNIEKDQTKNPHLFSGYITKDNKANFGHDIVPG